MLPLAVFVLEGCCSIHLSYGREMLDNLAIPPLRRRISPPP